jgi:Serine dehydrogenase proteinase
MPTWGELLQELIGIRQQFATSPPVGEGGPAPNDVLRRKYVKRLSDLTGRATIVYYSGFLQHPGAPGGALQVSPADMSGFMEACSNVEERELDLFLHSPGGIADAAEQISEYLRTRFDHIRAVVPLYAMSAATMLALSADEILMGAHSQLGPIDPQFTVIMPEGPRTASAQAIKDQFALAVEQCKDPGKLNAWLPILRSYAPGMLAACDHAAERAKRIVTEALREYMFKGQPDAAEKAENAAEWFGDAEEFLSHGRPVRREKAREHGVVIRDLEDDGELQDAVLSVHHTVLISMTMVPIAKLIENHKERAWMQTLQQIQFPVHMLGAPGPAPMPQMPGPPAPPAPSSPPATPAP